MIEPFETKEAIDLNNEYILETQSGKYWKMILSFSIVLIIIIILGIIVIYLSVLDFEDNQIKITCKYYITNSNNVEQIVSNEFKDYTKSNISIYIDGQLKEYNNTQKFSDKGSHTVIFLVNRILKLENMFKNIENLISINISSHYGYLNASLSYAFSNCIKLENISFYINTLIPESMSHMFYNCINLKNVIFNLGENNKNTNKTRLASTVKNMAYMFKGCNELTSLNLTLFDTKNVRDFSSMFESCNSLKSLDLSNFNTNLTTKMNSMFSNCKGISEIDISNFNTTLVEDMSYMFYNCEKLTSLNYSNLFKPKKNAKYDNMFDNCPVERPPWYNKSNDSIKDFL